MFCEWAIEPAFRFARYSTMLAENLVDKPSEQYAAQDKPRIAYKKGDDANIPEQVNDGKQSHLVRLLVSYLDKRQISLPNVWHNCLEPQLDTTDNDDEYDVQCEDEVVSCLSCLCHLM